MGCIKVLADDRATECCNEAQMLRLAQQAPSRHLCRLLEVVFCADTHLPVLFMELLLPLPSTLTSGELLAVTRGVSDALAQLWRHCVVHNDVKPANLLRRPGEFEVVLTDFGSAFIADASVDKLSAGDAEYLAPDRFVHRELKYLHMVDVFALGMSVVVLATGKLLPITAVAAGAAARLDVALQRLRLLPSPLEEACSRALARSAEERPSAEQLLLLI